MSSSFWTMSLPGPSPGPTSVSASRKAKPRPNSRPMVRASAPTLAAGLKLIITSAAQPAIMGKVTSMLRRNAIEVA